jgi:hypothetical protein
MMKGYLTVFLSLSLSLLTGFVLVLTACAIRNAGKVRLEGTVDTGMNSVLAEFSIALMERYGLLYIDASYGREPSASNIENRLTFYISHNLGTGQEEEPWGRVYLNHARVWGLVTAAEGKGSSMKYQAAKYIQDSGIVREEAEVWGFLSAAAALEGSDALGEWSAVQEQIAGIELPLALNEKGEWVEVPLGNPADRIYGFAGSDILYLLDMDTANMGIGRIRQEDYISHREIRNQTGQDIKTADDGQFLTYLFEMMGNYRSRREDSFLQYELEYIAAGEASDYENLQAVMERLLQWRFSVNAAYIMESGMYAQAEEIAGTLYAVQLKEEFREPVAKSILYACAFMESIGEMKALAAGGRAGFTKDIWHTAVEDVLTGELPSAAGDGEGLSYEQYIGCFLMLLPEETRLLRSMDIMEMDMRSMTGNPNFAMDWCVERFHAEVYADGAMKEAYVLNRTYGYY